MIYVYIYINIYIMIHIQRSHKLSKYGQQGESLRLLALWS